MNRPAVAVAVALIAVAPIAYAQSSAPAGAAPAEAQPRRAIQLSPAERQAIDDAAVRAVRPASVEQALQPSDDKVEQYDDSLPRIVQRRKSNRVSEVRVTPSYSNRPYVIENREGRQPLSVTQMNSGLSVPMFRIEFGGSAVPAADSPPPPASR